MSRPARDARSSRKSVIRLSTAGSAEEADAGAQLRPSKVGFKKSAMRQVSTKEEPDQDALQSASKSGRSSRRSMAFPAASSAAQEAETDLAGDVDEESLSLPVGSFGPKNSVGRGQDARRSQRVSVKARQSIKPSKDSESVTANA